MLDKLIGMFKKVEAIHRVQSILSCVAQLMQHFEQDALTDPTMKNAGIDAVVQLLQAQKD